MHLFYHQNDKDGHGGLRWCGGQVPSLIYIFVQCTTVKVIKKNNEFYSYEAEIWCNIS